jgi:uracil-DNA glycosylase
MCAQESKRLRLLALANKRKSSCPAQYCNVGDFHGGLYETNFIFPWSKSAHNVDADIVVVAQDWASTERLAGPRDCRLAELGHDPNLDTNINLKRLLKEQLGREFGQTYAIEAFPFIKKGKMSARIPFGDVAALAKEYAIPVIKIVRPKLAICLGLTTFNALRKAQGLKILGSVEVATQCPFFMEGTAVCGVAHTGALGTNMRNRKDACQTIADWASLRAFLPRATPG